MTESKFNQLQSHQTTRCNTLNQKLLDLKHQSETMEKETLEFEQRSYEHSDECKHVIGSTRTANK